MSATGHSCWTTNIAAEAPSSPQYSTMQILGAPEDYKHLGFIFNLSLHQAVPGVDFLYTKHFSIFLDGRLQSALWLNTPDVPVHPDTCL